MPDAVSASLLLLDRCYTESPVCKSSECSCLLQVPPCCRRVCGCVTLPDCRGHTVVTFLLYAEVGISAVYVRPSGLQDRSCTLVGLMPASFSWACGHWVGCGPCRVVGSSQSDDWGHGKCRKSSLSVRCPRAASDTFAPHNLNNIKIAPFRSPLQAESFWCWHYSLRTVSISCFPWLSQPPRYWWCTSPKTTRRKCNEQIKEEMATWH